MTDGGDRPLAAGEVLALHRLCRCPDVHVPWYATWRLEREGLVAPTGGGGKHVTDRGAEVLAAALARQPRLNSDTVVALTAVERAGPDGLTGSWPGRQHTLEVARLFGLVRSLPPDAWPHERATLLLTEAGWCELGRLRASRRAAAPMSRTQAMVVRAVAIGHRRPVAADRSYASCHSHGWLAWVVEAPAAGERRRVTSAGWRAVVGHHRREKVPLRLPVSALVPGHVIRTAGRGLLRVARVAPVSTTSGRRYVLIAAASAGGPAAPYPDRRSLPPGSGFEVVDYQQPEVTCPATRSSR